MKQKRNRDGTMREYILLLSRTSLRLEVTAHRALRGGVFYLVNCIISRSNTQTGMEDRVQYLNLECIGGGSNIGNQDWLGLGGFKPKAVLGTE
jgi:hypothetical protein